jgi:hypothetical protein
LLVADNRCLSAADVYKQLIFSFQKRMTISKRSLAVDTGKLPIAACSRSLSTALSLPTTGPHQKLISYDQLTFVGSALYQQLISRQLICTGQHLIPAYSWSLPATLSLLKANPLRLLMSYNYRQLKPIKSWYHQLIHVSRWFMTAAYSCQQQIHVSRLSLAAAYSCQQFYPCQKMILSAAEA